MKSFFELYETDCPCCGLQPKQELIDVLNRIRKDFGKPISVGSAMRCPKHNKKIGGAVNSWHMKGLAADLVRTPELLAFLEPRLKEYGVRMEHPDHTRAGSGWIHIDLAPGGAGKIFIPGLRKPHVFTP